MTGTNDYPWPAWWCVFLATTGLVSVVEAGAIYYPVEEGLVFHYEDTVNVSYATDYNKPTLWFCWRNSTGLQRFQQLASSLFLMQSSDQCTDNEYSYVAYDDLTPKNGSYLVTIDREITADDCWFNVFQGSGDPGINSVTFSVSPSERSHSTTLGLESEPTTAISSTATAHAEATSAVKTSSTPTPTSAGAEDDDDSSSGGLSTGAKAGIGVGAALAALGILALAVFFWRRRGRASDTGGSGGDGIGSNGGGLHERSGLVQSWDPATTHTQVGVIPKAELEAAPQQQRQPPVEMPA
ncbi:uncharacterized protein F5Z01DRAFT_222407 [Emericellopsis atlantica]|uniref:Mid2 domain-containing protein n=1 Tax=Emericellopsis atlantica TaxID=2614577 RepID=A0A9P7ZIR5_9HYPO|nr:uncharacterized protein F5Z01DRAFT_222407 [Emericellopsis atlantica]KAG9252671.1 hypothetical protein F5Z01DRAFT_222407 [Emericellopsis atlantica]